MPLPDPYADSRVIFNPFAVARSPLKPMIQSVKAVQVAEALCWRADVHGGGGGEREPARIVIRMYPPLHDYRLNRSGDQKLRR